MYQESQRLGKDELQVTSSPTCSLLLETAFGPSSATMDEKAIADVYV